MEKRKVIKTYNPIGREGVSNLWYLPKLTGRAAQHKKMGCWANFHKQRRI